MADVAVVLVSHSSALADGLRELVAPMAPDVTVATAGGLPGGGLGTDLDRVQEALATALEAAGHAVALCDLGGAVMTTEIALELLEHPGRAVVEAGVDHVSAYSLIVEEGTRMTGRMRRGELPYPSDDVAADRYLAAEAALPETAFHWYEMTN